ncbi:MAG: O-antigen ligase C-terminal domain-containing protein [Burkholderiales bacterium]|nr:O-antigen ligase C-terminal domain-containing protein [Burkholderiales bacterium]
MRHARLMLAAAAAAATGPALLAFNVSPSPTYLNQALALALWGGFVALASLYGGANQSVARALRDAALPAAALGLLLLATLWSWGPGALPSGLALSSLGLLLAAGLLLLSGSAVGAGPQAVPLAQMFFAGWVLAGVLSALVGALQVFAPSLPDGNWIARSGLPGRAVGNLRQPNHLSSLLLWSAMALVPLLELGRVRRGIGWALFAALVLGVVLTASRTGVLGIGLLALWGLLDRRLSRSTRLLLVLSPLLYLLAWLGLAAWAEASQHAFGGEARLAEADLSGSRFGIWANTLALIRQQPWTGVGLGEFNLAWTLTPFPGRPVAFFDHTHNLPLQLAVELGLPLAALVIGLLLAALWQVWQRARVDDDASSLTRRTAWMMVLLIALHSQLEYPLWYAYFLLPAAWLLGYGLGRPATTAAAAAAAASSTRPLLVAGVLLAIGGALSLADYARVAMIFAAPSDGTPLAHRIADGQRSWLFSHHASYAAVTVDDRLPASDPAFADAPHYLLDARLMMAWARALERSGEHDKARYVAQRLREFRNPQADEFFEPCDDPVPGAPLPFQCQAPSRPLGWRDFVR